MSTIQSICPVRSQPVITQFYDYSAHQGLQGLAKAILDVNMTKDRKIRCGDWEAETLSEDQVYYCPKSFNYSHSVFVLYVFRKTFTGPHTFYNNFEKQ